MRTRATCAAALRLCALAGLCALASAGCARLFSHFDVAPNGLTRSDDQLRRLLARGQADSAFKRIETDDAVAPGDELLRTLDAGILAHYSGAYDSSDVALERAAELAEDRYTKSISRATLSLVTSDRILPYEPGPTERLLIHYYGALNRLRRSDFDGAAVEARRLAFLLERQPQPDDAHANPILAFLRYFTGVVFEAAGERNDAEVAYRNALMLAPRGDSLLRHAPLGDSLGEVVVAVEQGFVAHRVEQSLIVPLHPIEVEWLTGADGEDRAAAVAEVAARVGAALLARSTPRPFYRRRPPTLHVSPPPRDYFERSCSEQGAEDDGGDGKEAKDHACPDDNENPYIMRIAWPAFRQEHEPITGLRLVADGGAGASPTIETDVSSAVVRDYETERTLVLTRTLVRAASKLALTKGVEKNVGGEKWVGRVLGALTNASTALLEQADTRSWHLLPDRIGLVRLQLPPGIQRLRIELPDDEGARTVEIGTADVRAGGVTVLSARLWW